MMRVIITAVGRDHWGLADPIVHYVASVEAHIAEIQMYDRDDGDLFALLLRLKWPGTAATLADLRTKTAEISREGAVSIRTWARDEHDRRRGWLSAPPNGRSPGRQWCRHFCPALKRHPRPPPKIVSHASDLESVGRRPSLRAGILKKIPISPLGFGRRRRTDRCSRETTIQGFTS